MKGAQFKGTLPSDGRPRFAELVEVGAAILRYGRRTTHESIVEAPTRHTASCRALRQRSEFYDGTYRRFQAKKPN